MWLHFPSLVIYGPWFQSFLHIGFDTACYDIDISHYIIYRKRKQRNFCCVLYSIGTNHVPISALGLQIQNKGNWFFFRIIAPLLFYSIANKWVQKKPYTIAGLDQELLVPAWATDMKLSLTLLQKTINMRKTKDSRTNSLLFDKKVQFPTVSWWSWSGVRLFARWASCTSQANEVFVCLIL